MQKFRILFFQKELQTVQFEWNTHRIRNSRNAIAPSGRPVILFELPEACDTRNYLHEVSAERISMCKEYCTYHILPCDTDIFELCRIIMEENGYLPPKDPYEAADLYLYLRREINNLLALN